MADHVELATAYINIVPSAQGMQGSITEMFSGEAQSAGLATGQTMGDNMAEGVSLSMIASAAAIVGTVAGVAREAWQVVNEVAEYGDTIDKQSQMMSISARAYQELSFAAERSGTNINTFGRGIRNINEDMADAANGVEGATEKFDRLGVSFYNANGQMRTTEEVLMDSIMALADMEDVTQRNAIANDIFGRSYTELLPLLNTGADGVQDLFTRFNDLNGAMSDEGVQASADFEDAMTDLRTAVQGVKNNLAESGLLGAFTDFIERAADWVAGDHPILVRAFHLLDTEVQNNERHMSAMTYALDGAESVLSPRIEAIRQMFHNLGEDIVEELRGISPEMGLVGEALGANFSNMFLHPFRTAVDNIIALIAGLNGDISTASAIMGVNIAGASKNRTTSTVQSRKATFQ